MKLIIEQVALKKALDRVTSVVERRNTIPILSNVMLEGADGEVWLTATDLDIEARSRVEATVEEAGAITAAAGLLSDIVRNAPEGSEVSLQHGADDPRLIVKFGRSKYQVPILPAGDFPKRKEAQGVDLVTMKAPDFASLIERTGFAMSTEETRYYLCGAYLHLIADEGRPVLRMAATCGRRMAMAQVDAPAGTPGFRGAIIPRKTVAEFARALAGKTGDVQVGVSASEISLEMEGLVIRSKVIDGSYPDYARVIPADWTNETIIDRALLAAAVRRVAIVDNAKVRGVKLIAENGVLTLQARNTDNSQAVEEIEVEGPEERTEVAFNARFLQEAIDQTDADYLVLRTGDRSVPARLEPPASDPEAGQVLSILMPMAV